MPRYSDLFPVECRVEAVGVGAAQILDAMPSDAGWGAEWEVVARETGTGNTESRVFRAIHDGSSAVTKSEYAHMVVTGSVSGLQLDAGLVPVSGGHELRLLGYSDNEVNFRVTRKRIG